MKQCTKCGEVKPLEAFGKRKASKDGLRSECRKCKAHSADTYREANREQERERAKAWYEGNREQHATSMKTWREANRPRRNALIRAYKAGLATATPMWLSKGHRDAIAAIYAEAARLTEETGIPHHVDHIIPLKGRGVCGLHVPWNLRAIPAAENMSKSNRLILD